MERFRFLDFLSECTATFTEFRVVPSMSAISVLSKLAEEEWGCLKSVLCGIRCMATGTSLVGNSKVLAHMLPNLVPLVDREYMLNFLFRNKQITNDLYGEWEKLRKMLRDFFYPVAQDPLFRARADEWLAQRDRFRWDTLVLKIVDNLVIGLSTISRTEKEPAKSQAALA